MAESLTHQQRLVDERVAAITEARQILDTAKSESRSASGEEKLSVHRAFGRVDAIDAMLDKFRTDEVDDRVSERSLDNTGRLNMPNSTTNQVVSHDDANIAAFLEGKTHAVRFDIQHTHNTYGRRRAESRSLTVGTSTEGGYTVPEGFKNSLYDYRELISGFRRANPEIMMTPTGNNVPMPLVTSRSTAAIVGEGGTIMGDQPVFGEKTMLAFKYGIIIPVTHELSEDNGVNLESWLARDMGRAMARAMENDYINGNGTTAPEGILGQAEVGITGGTAVTSGNNQRAIGHPVADELIELVESIDEGYRQEEGRCMWMMRPSTFGKIRQFKGLDGQYLWEPSLKPGYPDMFLGYPLVKQPYVPAVGSGAKSILFGNFYDAVVVRDVAEVRFNRSIEDEFKTDRISYRCLMRSDSRVRDTEAVKTFQGGTA